MSAGAVDAFPVDAAVGIDFGVWRWVIGDMLRHLPVGVAVYGLVARIGDVILRLLQGFLRRVLPPVAVLQLEIGVARQPSIVQRNAVVLTNVTIASHT